MEEAFLSDLELKQGTVDFVDDDDWLDTLGEGLLKGNL